MMATITSICVGLPKTVRFEGKEVLTGIFKAPIKGPVRVGEMGIDGDGQANLRVHGGRDKAVYAYPALHYPAWARELGRELEPSQFGENLAVSGLDETSVVIGDRYRAGTVEMLVAQPRSPCAKLGIRMGDAGFPPRFLASGRLGFYLRVEQPGTFAAGDEIVRLSRPAHGITVHDVWQTVFNPSNALVPAARCLDELPHLDAGWVRRLQGGQ